METTEFKTFGKAAVDYIAHYCDTIRDRKVLPSVQPGYLRPLIPDSIPDSPDQWADVMSDMDKFIMPGITHWRSPRFHAYYTAGMSLPSVVGEILSAGLGVVGINWMSSPACTELELVVMDWLAKAMGLPENLLNSSDGPGGGVIQSTASEATLIALLAAKEKTVRRLKESDPCLTDQEIKAKLICYCSDQANSSVEKAGILASVPMHQLPTDDCGRLRGSTLQAAIEADKAEGLIPCFAVTTFGTTGTCAFDCVDEIGPVCNQENVWLHIDAAYAGGALICPEFRHLMSRIDYADSLVINVHKWLLVNFDCSAMWLKNSRDVIEPFTVDRLYLQHQSQEAALDFRNWEISLGRRFRSLKMWFTIRLYGLSGLQNHIRQQVAQAQQFEKLLLQDHRFELVSPTCMSLVCFRLKGPNTLIYQLLDKITEQRTIYLLPASFREKVFIRFVIFNDTTIEDLKFSLNEIQNAADSVISIFVDNGCRKMSTKTERNHEDLHEIKSNVKHIKQILA